MIAGLIHFIWKLIWNATLILVCAGLIFIGFKANQPMSVPDAPEGMSYVEFMKDRMDAAKTIEPSRCGWGMMFSLAALGPIYSVVYTAVAINPEGTDLPPFFVPLNKLVFGRNWRAESQILAV